MQSYQDIFSLMPVIRTKRLTLRAARMSDAEDLYEYSRDPAVARHVLWDAHTSIHQTRTYIRYLLRQYKSGQPSSFVITMSDTGKAIGTIGFMWIQQDHRSAEVGYSLSRDYWNRGIMTEALRAIIDMGFTKLNLNRIEAMHEVDNPASGKVMQKAGMHYEGRLRQRVYNKGRFADVDLYAILRQDFVSSNRY
ncbi:MAG: GNAT family N-acetyltransferase [Clostridiales bacterium]|nr:GNAT family N-acetyltransferase [Clostridiales bacterium]